MSLQSFSALKQQKCQQKKSLSINKQIPSNELECLQITHTFLSPLSGNSQCLTENGSFTKLNEIMIEEPLLDAQYDTIFSDLDNTEYYIQTLVFTTMQELQSSIQKIKRSYNGLMMPINEIQIEDQPDQLFTLKIKTRKFIDINFRINIRALCEFIEKVIISDVEISSNDIIQYYDMSIHINPISLFKNNYQKQSYYEALREVLIKCDLCEEIQIILEMLKDFENQDLDKLKCFKVIDKDIYHLNLQLINLLYKRIKT